MARLLRSAQDPSAPSPRIDSAALPRREFLYRLAAGATAGALVPGNLMAATDSAPRGVRPGTASRPGYGPGRLDEDFWQEVKARFPLRPDRVNMNAANLCPTPTGVTEAITIFSAEIDGDQSFQNRARFDPMRDEARAEVAGYLGADPDEVALVRNTSEANNIVIGGLDLGPGDEVVIWDQNHASNSVAWDVRAQRRGFSVRRVATPPDPQDPEALLAPFLAAMGPSTRVLALTHVSNVTGARLPVREICRAARERGVLTLVDGAQTFGSDVLDLHDLGCDFFTGSAHKWFVGPKEVGILYAREGVAERVWPGVVSVGWDGARERGALRFETLGQRDDARVVGMETAVCFHRWIGRERIESRIGELMGHLRMGIADAVPGVEFVTPAQPALRGGVLIFRLPGVDFREGYEALYRDHGIVGAAIGGGIRLCPHVYNTLDDAEAAVAGVAAVAGRA
jgi:isopenicillin-N epimerase